MGAFRYAIVQSQGGLVQMPNGPATILQVLNLAGQQGGELAAVVPAATNIFEWVIKFPSQAPAQPFE
jgi:hypothetical protein